MKNLTGILLFSISLNVFATNVESPVSSVTEESILGPNVVETTVIDVNSVTMLLKNGATATLSTTDDIHASHGIHKAFDDNPGSHWTSKWSSYENFVLNGYRPSANANIDFDQAQRISKVSIRIHQITPRYANGVGTPARIEIYGVDEYGNKTLKHESSIDDAVTEWTDSDLLLEFVLDDPQTYDGYILKLSKGFNWTRFHTINLIP